MVRRKADETWLHEASGFWSKKINGKLYRLDRDYRVAKKKLAGIRRAIARQGAGEDHWLGRSFQELCEEFLDDAKARKEASTYRSYRYRLVRALKHLPLGLRVAEFRRIHLSQVERKLIGTMSPTTVRDTLSAVQTVFGWAVKQDLIEQNPVAGYTKPRGRQRSRIVSPPEFQALLRALWRNSPFRRVLIAMRHTGARPSEIRNLTWDMVNLEQGVWIIRKHKTITMQRDPLPRIIPLPDCVAAMCQWLKNRATTDEPHVFLNAWGRPYTKDRFVQTMDRARKRAGLKTDVGEQIVLYSNRHTFATEAVSKVSTIELSALMGHTDVETTKRYVHLNLDRLKDIQRRVQS
jgi:integrase